MALIKFSNTAEVRDPSLKFIPVYRADFVEGSYVKTNYNIGDICNFTITKDASWSYKIVDCTEGDEFYIITYSGNTSRGYCFLDVNNTVLSVCGNAQNISILITAPKVYRNWSWMVYRKWLQKSY